MKKIEIVIILIFISFISCNDNPTLKEERTTIEPEFPVWIIKRIGTNELLATSYYYFYTTEDNGNSWEKFTKYYDYKAHDIHGNIYAIYSDDYLYKSEDNCENWEKLEISNYSYPAWKFLVNSAGNVIKSYSSDDTPDDIFFVNINSYSEKKIFTSQGDFINIIFLASDDYIFVFADEKLYRSKDDGNNWDEIELEINFRNSYRVGMIESKQQYIYLSIQNLIFYSTDFGDIWEKVSTEFDNVEIQFVDNSNNIFFYSSNSNFGSRELFITSDNFNSFANVPLDDKPSAYGKLFVDNGIIYLPLNSGGMKISNDMGQTWIEPKWYED